MCVVKFPTHEWIASKVLRIPHDTERRGVILMLFIRVELDKATDDGGTDKVLVKAGIA